MMILGFLLPLGNPFKEGMNYALRAHKWLSMRTGEGHLNLKAVQTTVILSNPYCRACSPSLRSMRPRQPARCPWFDCALSHHLPDLAHRQICVENAETRLMVQCTRKVKHTDTYKFGMDA